MPELRLGGRRGLHGGTERKDHSQVSGLSTLGGWDVRDWRRHSQDKGQLSGSQGWEWTCRLCVPRGLCLSGCRQESRVPVSGWRGKLGADSVREKIHKQRIGIPPAEATWVWPWRREAARCRGGPPKPACSEDAPQATVWSCVRECCPLFLPPLQPGQQGATAQGHKLILLLPLTLLSFCSLSFLVAARGVCVCVCVCACVCVLYSQCLSLVS